MDRLYRAPWAGVPAPRFALKLLCLSLLASPALGASTELPATRVEGEADSGYQVRQASVGGFDEAPLLDTPASISVINAALIKDQQARLLSEVLRNDASVGDSYAPIGYYENFVVRGFSLNAASSYKINGRTVTSEQNVALENKQRVELLKGLATQQPVGNERAGQHVAFEVQPRLKVHAGPRRLRQAIHGHGGFKPTPIGPALQIVQDFPAIEYRRRVAKGKRLNGSSLGWQQIPLNGRLGGG